MANILEQIKEDVAQVVSEWLAAGYLKAGDVFVIGCSTSEVKGEHIGTAGSEDIAEVIFSELKKIVREKQIHLAFQCCEHLNRAVVVEQETMVKKGFEQVSVIPHPRAGGSMASYAYKHFENAVVVETIVADAGIDIGDTMIGMHLKPVAVPLRFDVKKIGNAHLAGARTRPKLIGGVRAKYA